MCSENAERSNFARNRSGRFAVFWIEPDSRRRRANRVVTAFPFSPNGLKRAPAKAELELMLPGFRFLFAAIALSMSILIFGLGAAALLRAAHEEFASSPSRRTPPEPVFAQSEAPTLALLRVEPPAADQAPEPVPVPPVETEPLAALTADDSAQPETEMPVAQPSPEPETVQVEPPASTEAVKLAAVEQPSLPSEAAPTIEPVIVPPAPESIGAATKIATLGGAVTIEEPASAKPARVKPDKSAVRERLRAQRLKERRRIAQLRARRAAAAAAAQQPFDLFSAQPTITTRKR